MIRKNNSLIFVLGLLILISAIQPAHSQRRRAFDFQNLPQHDQKDYHFGFSLGFNKLNFSLKPISNLHNVEMAGNLIAEFDTLKSVLPEAEYGFNIGIVSNLRLADQWDLRFIPTLTFGDRNVVYSGIKNGSPITRTQQLESTFVDFPLHIKYKSVRMTNTRVYVIGGLKYSHDLASIEDKEDFEDELLVRIGKNDFFYEMGAGFEYYFQFFKFSTEIKASFGVFDMLSRENSMFANSIDRLNSKIIMVSFLFE